MHTDKCRYMRGISLVVEQVVAKFPHKFCKNDQIRVRFPDTAFTFARMAERLMHTLGKRDPYGWPGSTPGPGVLIFRKNKNV